MENKKVRGDRVRPTKELSKYIGRSFYERSTDNESKLKLIRINEVEDVAFFESLDGPDIGYCEGPKGEYMFLARPQGYWYLILNEDES
jgi:hypothetical protein